MKIISQSTDELVLKEGDASGIVFGIIAAVIGAVVAVRVSPQTLVTLLIGIGFVIVGLGMVFWASSISVDVNKTNGQLSYKKKRLIGGSSATYAIADILRVETRREWRMEGGGGQRSMPHQVLVSQSVIVFKDGQELPLDHQKGESSMSIGPAVLMGGQGKEMAIANQVATFMGVPFQEISPGHPGVNINLGGPGAGGIQL